MSRKPPMSYQEEYARFRLRQAKVEGFLGLSYLTLLVLLLGFMCICLVAICLCVVISAPPFMEGFQEGLTNTPVPFP